MKLILALLFLFTLSFSFAQSDSTKTDTTRTKEWNIKLSDEHQAFLKEFDQQQSNLENAYRTQLQSIQQQRDTYIKSILIGKKVKLNNIKPGTFKYEKGTITFVELKP